MLCTLYDVAIISKADFLRDRQEYICFCFNFDEGRNVAAVQKCCYIYYCLLLFKNNVLSGLSGCLNYPGGIEKWRRRPDSNRCIKVLQTSALPLGYAAIKKWSGKRDLNPRLQPWQGRTLPLSYSRSESFQLYVKYFFCQSNF